jgi:hypothetical protein
MRYDIGGEENTLRSQKVVMNVLLQCIDYVTALLQLLLRCLTYFPSVCRSISVSVCPPPPPKASDAAKFRTAVHLHRMEDRTRAFQT